MWLKIQDWVVIVVACIAAIRLKKTRKKIVDKSHHIICKLTAQKHCNCIAYVNSVVEKSKNGIGSTSTYASILGGVMIMIRKTSNRTQTVPSVYFAIHRKLD